MILFVLNRTCVCVCIKHIMNVILANLSLIFSFNQLTKLPVAILWLQYCLLYYVSTLIQFFGDLNHVAVFRQRPESDCFVILAAHVISTQHQRTTHSRTPTTLQSSVERHRESLLPEKQRSVYCVVTFSTHRTNLEREKGVTNKYPLFPRKQDGVCCCALGCDVIVMVHPRCDLWADDSQIASSGGVHQLEH